MKSNNTSVNPANRPVLAARKGRFQVSIWGENTYGETRKMPLEPFSHSLSL